MKRGRKLLFVLCHMLSELKLFFIKYLRLWLQYSHYTLRIVYVFLHYSLFKSYWLELCALFCVSFHYFFVHVWIFFPRLSSFICIMCIFSHLSCRFEFSFHLIASSCHAEISQMLLKICTSCSKEWEMIGKKKKLFKLLVFFREIRIQNMVKFPLF